MLASELLVDESRPDELLPLDTDSGESRFLFWPVPDGWFVSGEDGTFQISGGVLIMCVCPSGDGTGDEELSTRGDVVLMAGALTVSQAVDRWGKLAYRLAGRPLSFR